MYTLYYAPGAASMVVHWLLLELDQLHELRLVDTGKREHKTLQYLAMNPNGVVPTLLVDGAPMSEAAAMLMHLADKHAHAGLAPGHDSDQRRAYTQWMFHLANVVQPLFRQWWYPHEPAGEANIELVKQSAATRVGEAWDRIDAHLAASGPYLLGDAPCVADFYLVMLMRWSRNMPRPATNWPCLDALARQLTSRPSFKLLYVREGLSEWP